MKKYANYFRYVFLVLAILIVLNGILLVVQALHRDSVRTNDSCPTERVYDHADVLTDGEEASLRELIARYEPKIGSDIILVTINTSLYAQYGITEDTDSNWEQCMMNYADVFYDENQYGYDKPMGDGVLLLDNWCEGEKGSWLSTSGKVYDHYSYSMIDTVLDDVYYYADQSPYKAYKAYVEDVYNEMSGNNNQLFQIPGFGIFVAAIVAAVVFMLLHLKNNEGVKTTSVTTYVENHAPMIKLKEDNLLHKHVTTTHIEHSSSSGSNHSGRAGGHTSPSGSSHGGGGRRR